MGAKIKTPPKNPWDQNLTPKKSHAEFPSHNNFQKAEIVVKQVWFYFIRGTTRPGVCGNYCESSDCFQAAQKKYLPKFSYSKKIPKSKISIQKYPSIISVATVILSVKEIRISIMNVILTKKISTNIIIKCR